MMKYFVLLVLMAFLGAVASLFLKKASAIGGIIGGFIGSKMLKKIPDKYLKIFFIIFLGYSTIKLIFFS